jgi:hypothetical protein
MAYSLEITDKALAEIDEAFAAHVCVNVLHRRLMPSSADAR